MAVAGAEIMDKVGAGPRSRTEPKINNFGSATMGYYIKNYVLTCDVPKL